jgi:hypothetical protein
MDSALLTLIFLPTYVAKLFIFWKLLIWLDF